MSISVLQLIIMCNIKRAVGKSVHIQSEDLPDFTEYRTPWGRVELLDRQVFAATQECLLQSLMVAIKY